MKKITVVFLFLSLMSSFKTMAALPETPGKLNFTEIVALADKLEMTREDCNMPRLSDLFNHTMRLVNAGKVDSKSGLACARKIADHIMSCKKNRLSSYDDKL